MHQVQSQALQQSRNSQLQEVSAKCQKKNPAAFLCINEDCKYSGLICKQQSECQCQKIHKQCSRISLTSMRKKFKNKQLMMEPIIKSILQQFDKFIQEVIEKRAQVAYQLKNCIYGLNIQERLVRNCIRGQNNYADIITVNGIIAAKVFEGLKQESFKFLIQQEQNYIKQLWKNQRKSFDMFSASIKDFLQNPQFNFPRMDTNTISQAKDKNYICSMFKKPIKEFQLLYRASHNNFKIHKFHLRCDGKKDTLVLVRTQADKVIGGFTVLAWDKQNILKQDKSLKSFLFSVTQKEKYRLCKNKPCIRGAPRKGPIFGINQILIQDQSNKNQSKFQLGSAYKGNGITENNPFSNQHFSGSQTGKIKIKQWEVFKVHFV